MAQISHSRPCPAAAPVHLALAVPTNSHTPTTTQSRCRQQTLRGRAPYNRALTRSNTTDCSHTYTATSCTHATTLSALPACRTLQQALRGSTVQGPRHTRHRAWCVTTHTNKHNKEGGFTRSCPSTGVGASCCQALRCPSRQILSTLNGHQTPTGTLRSREVGRSWRPGRHNTLTIHQPQPKTVLAAQPATHPVMRHSTCSTLSSKPRRARRQGVVRAVRDTTHTAKTAQPQKNPFTPANASSRRTVAQVVKMCPARQLVKSPAPCGGHDKGCALQYAGARKLTPQLPG